MQKSNLIKSISVLLLLALVVIGLVVAKEQYSNTDFGDSFGTKAMMAETALLDMNNRF